MLRDSIILYSFYTKVYNYTKTIQIQLYINIDNNYLSI